MYKLVLGVVLTVTLACNDKTIPPTKEQLETTVPPAIIHAEYLGIAPTTPEETEYYLPKVPSVTVQNSIPSDAIVLFNGENFDHWIQTVDSTSVKWHLNNDGSMTVADKTGNIQTKQNFGDLQLHLEWRSPKEIRKKGQNRANSGVFINGLYEIQILNNHENDTYVNGQVGAVYKQHIPLVNASAPVGSWNSYDIVYRAPIFNRKGEKITAGTITLLHNGVLVQDHVPLKGTTEYIGWPKNKAHGKGPILLQDHKDNSGVSFRNIWVRPL